MEQCTKRIRLEALNLTLKGYAPAEAEALSRALPQAIARHLDRPDTEARDLTGQIARQVAAELRGHIEGEG